MAKKVKCYGGGYIMVGKYTKAQENDIYRRLGDGPKLWFRPGDPARTATPEASPGVATSRNGEPLPTQDGSAPADDGPPNHEAPNKDG